MKLFFTDRTFEFTGMPRPGIPFLCDQEMELVGAANRYLRYIAVVRGRSRSPRTWETNGRDLYEYFAWLEANGFEWDEVNQTHVAAWRDGMLERGCARSTVNQRLRCVDRFYQWAQTHGEVDAVPFDREEVRVRRPQHFMMHVDGSGGLVEANDLTMQTHKPVPKFLHLDQAIRFLESLSPHLLKLMGYLALLTGMRREEIVGLDRRVLPNPCGCDPDKQIRMLLDPELTPTKGNKERFVQMPYDLGVALWNYFVVDWPTRNALHKRLHGRETTRLFISEYGEEFSLRYLNNMFQPASEKTGIDCSPHKLRHTYATYELARMTDKMGQSKALLWVRDRLGHSSVTTTERYVHAMDLVKHDDIDGYQSQLMEALRGGH